MKPYKFQQEAVDKLTPMKSRFVADEMGLGKTVTAIYLDIESRRAYIKEHGKKVLKTLIVAPLAVHDSWEEHLSKILPQAPVVRVDPKNRSAFVNALKKPMSGFYIIHWQALRLMPELAKVEWFHIIGDEIHRIKNRKAQQTRALKNINSLYKTALSGTPADDKPHDFWQPLNWLWPQYYRSYWKFRKHYCTEETEIKGDTTYTKITGVKNGDSLREEISPFFIRRRKRDVLDDLPEKYYSKIEVTLSPKQRKAYDEMRKNMVAWLEKQDFTSPLIASVVIAQLTRLQQFALAYMEEHPHKPNTYLMTDPSAKLDVLMEIIEDNPDEQLVVFSQSKGILNLMARRLRAKGISCGLYTGDASADDRDQVVHDFQAGKLQVFGGTIAAGGEGITLTAASTVIFLDRAWNPNRNLQAEDRCHRIGQKNAVQIIDFVARDTVDMGRLAKIELKLQWLRELLGD